MRRTLLVPLLFDIALPIVGYYGLRFIGVRSFMALILAALPTLLYQLFQIIKHRKADFLALFILGIIALSIAASFITGNGRFMLAKSGWVTGIVGLSFISSLLLRKPFAFIIAKNLLARFQIPEQHLDSLWLNETRFRKAWNISTVIWGAGMLLNACLLVYMAYALPIDKVPLLAALLHGGTFLILQIITNKYLERLGIWKLVFAVHGEKMISTYINSLLIII